LSSFDNSIEEVVWVTDFVAAASSLAVVIGEVVGAGIDNDDDDDDDDGDDGDDDGDDGGALIAAVPAAPDVSVLLLPRFLGDFSMMNAIYRTTTIND